MVVQPLAVQHPGRRVAAGTRPPRRDARKGGDTRVSGPSMTRPANRDSTPDFGARTEVDRAAPWIEGRSHRDSQHGPAVWQEVLADGFRPGERVGSLRGDGAARVAGASGASAPSVPRRSDSSGYGLRARDEALRGFNPFRRQRRRGRSEDSFVPADELAELGAHRRLDSVREARGHERAAALVHPIKASPRTQDREDRKRSRREHPTNTVLGPRVAHSEVHANAMRGGDVGGDIGGAAGDCGSLKGDPPDGHLTPTW